MSTQFQSAYDSFLDSLNEESQKRYKKVIKDFHTFQEAQPEQHLHRNIIQYFDQNSRSRVIKSIVRYS